MSTRSLICKKENDGTYKSIYCHWDGYPGGVGATLLEYYNKDNIDELLALGSLSSLGKFINPQPNGKHRKFDFEKGNFAVREYFSDEHTFDAPQEDVCVAYHRDRGEDLRVSLYNSLDELNKEFKKSWCEYIYILEDNKWKVADEYLDFKDLSNVIERERHNSEENN